MAARAHSADTPRGGACATATTLSPGRVRARRLAARLLRGALDGLVAAGHDGATLRACAARLGVSHQHVARWCDDGAPAIALGDVLALGPRSARAVLTAALASTYDGDAVSTRDSVDRVAIHLGAALQSLLTDLADGREDDAAGHASRLEAIAEIALRGAASARARAAGGDL